jgi:hypothetical protein
MNSFASAYSHDSDIDNNNLLALLKERRRESRGAAEELRRGAHKGAAKPLRTSNSKVHGTPPSPKAEADSRTMLAACH